MSILPEAAWVEAARLAADRAYDAVGCDIEKLDLAVTSVSQADAAGTNSADRQFLDYLGAGGHLTDQFLAGVR